jgi:hypothetical protein
MIESRWLYEKRERDQKGYTHTHTHTHTHTQRIYKKNITMKYDRKKVITRWPWTITR